ncbi:MAG TPA: lysine N(6)-hydroxylase/L-ornithine N(5)-oxygenase family protein [Pseudonocardiaceae bacterium]|jgi:L-ornithine N5-oxygenase|nr:lysine N(6)-hydroxylase/L-ornithine N(5)-oxygenase family protein [Pseudonocardiaceae bacterium]
MPQRFPDDQRLPEDQLPIHDLIGVGFGPSNLALAIAVTENNMCASAQGAVSALFLERQPRFGWHRGMLIDDATMQVSFLKDLVTLRNPASEFSFLCYLHSKGRLVDFINRKDLFPLRIEFHDYFEWVAAQLEDLVAYDHQVVAVEPVTRDGRVVCFDVVARIGGGCDDLMVYRARNLVLSMGLEPNLPDGIVPRDRIWHNHDLLHRIENLGAVTVNRLTVVGAGQSAAEVTAFLHRRFPQAEVCAVFARFGYSPSDDSPFANQVFDPAAVGKFFLAPEEVKQMIMGYHANTNYSVVDLELINDLYRRVYQERVLGIERLRIFNLSRLQEVVETETGVRTTTESLATGEQIVLESDVLVYATGYRPVDPLPLLGELGGYCQRDEQGRLRVERDYRVMTHPPLGCGLYLQGGTEHTHGITSSLLSNTAIRSAEILESIIARRDDSIALSHDYVISGACSA